MFCTFLPVQAKLERDKKWSEESFWLRTVNLQETFTEDKFTNLYEVKAQVDRIYSLALENSMEQSIISVWHQHVILLQSLVDSFKNKSHKSALKHLKKVFGSSRGLNEENKKLVDSILSNMGLAICQLTLPRHFAHDCPTQRGFQNYVPFHAQQMEPFRPP